MAINKKLIHFKTKANFNAQLEAGNILDTSIVYIQDAKEIWTHGTIYGTRLSEEQIETIIANSDTIADVLAQIAGLETSISTNLNTAKAYTDQKIADLVGQAPEALNTVYELASAMSDNQTAIDTLESAIANKVDKTEAARTYIPFSGGLLTDGATLTLSQYGSRTVTISGNNIIADMSRDEGTWAGNFASVKDPVGDEITMLGWYGNTNGLIHVFMGGSYLNPAMKMTKDGTFTFMYNPKVGDKTIATNEDVTSICATKTELNNKQDKVLKFENKTASSWVSDNTYTDYSYRCDISCSGVTADMFAEVVFNVDEAISGDYAPICETKEGIVSIWSSANVQITILTIIITR